MKTIISTFFLLLIGGHSAWSQDLQITSQQLGQLEQRTEKVKNIEQYTGSQLIATVSEMSGQAYVLNAPMNVQRTVFEKSPGTFVEAGESFVTLIGPEVHHYYNQYKIYEQLHQQSAALYEHNKTLFQNQSISEASWLAVSQQFYSIKLIYDEYLHFFEYVNKVDESNESLVLGAPIDGFVSYKTPMSIETGSNLARFIPQTALRFKVKLPANEVRKIVSFQTPHCSLGISSVDKQTEAFLQTAWSESITDHCRVTLGQEVIVTPHYKANAYQVSRQSVFNWQGENYLFYQNQENYVAAKVILLSSTRDGYVVSSDISLDAKNALVTSVSAAQGILMGLGE